MARVRHDDGTEIEWDSHGDGSPVVLVHGITECKEAWDPVAERLAADRRVIRLDLRGHGASSRALSYDLASMALDVIAVIGAAGAERPDIVGHSLGGAVVSAVGAAFPVRTVTDVDQSLQLDGFKDVLTSIEPMLRDPVSFPGVMEGMFDGFFGPLPEAERERLRALQRPDREVVLGVWSAILDQSADEIAAVIDAALGGYSVPYLALFGADPGPAYSPWLTARIPSATVEVWPEHGHYPHLVEPDRFVARLHDFWATA